MNNNIEEVLPLLHLVSEARGGSNSFSSFVWCDRLEHLMYSLDEPYIFGYQIIGHTPVKTISTYSGKDMMLYFIDTHSTYRNGDPYGDQSYLVYNDNNFDILYSKDLRSDI